MKRSSLVFLVLLGFAAVVVGGDDKADHTAMKKEHAQAHAEHDAWQKQIGAWRVEHVKALAALREIESHILDHEASLEEISNHVAEHEDHIHHHDEEIATHEKLGDDKEHAKLAASHKQVMQEHAALQTQLKSFDDHHDELIAALGKLRTMLSTKK